MKSKVWLFIVFFVVGMGSSLVFKSAGFPIWFSVLLAVFLIVPLGVFLWKKEKKIRETKKSAEIDTMTNRMEMALVSSLDGALYHLHWVGIRIDACQPFGEKISLPPCFWGASPRLIACSLSTIVWHDAENVDRQELFQELRSLLEEKVGQGDVRILRIAMAIQKLRPEAVEVMY